MFVCMFCCFSDKLNYKNALSIFLRPYKMPFSLGPFELAHEIMVLSHRRLSKAQASLHSLARAFAVGTHKYGS